MRPADGPPNGSATLSRIRSLADHTIAMLESSVRKRQRKRHDVARLLSWRPIERASLADPNLSWVGLLSLRHPSRILRGRVTAGPGQDRRDSGTGYGAARRREPR